MPEPRTGETGSSSSPGLLPTPRAIDARPKGNGPRPDTLTGLLTYDDSRAAVDLLLKTPTAQLAANGGSQHPAKRRAGGHGPTLADQVEHELLPTPLAGDAKGTRNATASRSPGKTANAGTTLSDVAWQLKDLLPTPTASLEAPAPWKPGLDWWLQSRATRNLAGVVLGNTPAMGAAGPVVDWGRYSRVILRWQQVLGRMVPHPLMAGSKGNAVLSPVFVEWMMGLPEGWVTGCGLTRNAQLKILGNGVVPHQAVLGLRVLLARVPDEVIAWLSATS